MCSCVSWNTCGSFNFLEEVCNANEGNKCDKTLLHAHIQFLLQK